MLAYQYSAKAHLSFNYTEIAFVLFLFLNQTNILHLSSLPEHKVIYMANKNFQI